MLKFRTFNFILAKTQKLIQSNFRDVLVQISGKYKKYVAIFLWVFRGSETFSRGYFIGLKPYLVGILWVWNFFSWVFCGSIEIKLRFDKKTYGFVNDNVACSLFKS